MAEDRGRIDRIGPTHPEYPNSRAFVALGLTLFLAGVIFFYLSDATNARERELLRRLRGSQEGWESLNDQRLRELGSLAERLDGAVNLPTDAIGVVTEAGQLCVNGLDHPAGSRPNTPEPANDGLGGTLSGCPVCRRYLEHFAEPGGTFDWKH